MTEYPDNDYTVAIDHVIDMIEDMIQTGDYHNPTLEELLQRFM